MSIAAEKLEKTLSNKGAVSAVCCCTQRRCDIEAQIMLQAGFGEHMLY